MKSVCAWCGTVLAPEPTGEASGRVSHGICAACLAEVSADRPRSLRELLNNLPEPVLCVGVRGDILAANAAAERAMGRNLSGVAGTLGGDLFECRYARLPGGCGNTEHCAACTIRRTVTAVSATGQPVVDRRAWIDRTAPDGAGRRVDLVVSAEKTGDVVLLRIDRMEEAPDTPPAGLAAPTRSPAGSG
jgi:PAS domain-containing protein